jgi:hypothetical protein
LEAIRKEGETVGRLEGGGLKTKLATDPHRPTQTKRVSRFAGKIIVSNMRKRRFTSNRYPIRVA